MHRNEVHVGVPYISFSIIINLLENMEREKKNRGVLKSNRKSSGEAGVSIVVVKAVVDIEFIMAVDV